MNMVFLWLSLAALCVLAVWRLAAYALRHFNTVKLGGNIGRSGFFIEAKDKKK